MPWWLNPWREAVRQQRDAAHMAWESNERYERLRVSAKELERLRDDLTRAEREVASLRGQLAAAVTDARTSGAALSTAQPEFVLVGIPRGPGQGKRIQVSRDIEVTAFAMTEMGEGEPRFKIGAIMAKLLVIDKPTYGEALQLLATIWASQDRDSQPGARLTPVQGPLSLPGKE